MLAQLHTPETHTRLAPNASRAAIRLLGRLLGEVIR